MNIQSCRNCGKELPAGRKKYCDEHPSPTATVQKEKTEIRTKAGQCKSCSEPICSESKVFCLNHLIANRERGAKDRARRKREGICRSCNNPISPNSTTWCVEHHQKQNDLSRKLAREARSSELCVDCNEVPRIMRKRRCEECQASYEHKKTTTCSRSGCDALVDLKKYCRIHADEENSKLRERRSNMKQSNICIYCFKDLEEVDINSNHTLCYDCRNKQKEQRKAASVSVL